MLEHITEKETVQYKLIISFEGQLLFIKPLRNTSKKYFFILLLFNLFDFMKITFCHIEQKLKAPTIINREM